MFKREKATSNIYHLTFINYHLDNIGYYLTMIFEFVGK